MPYGYSRKRYAYRRRRGAARNAIKTAASKRRVLAARAWSDKSTKGLQWGSNMGNALHIDRGVMLRRGAFPESISVKLRYTDQLYLSADNLTGRSGTEIPYRLNSAFDPYFLTGGHQPLGFDQLTPIYGRYKVYKVDVQVRVMAKIGSNFSYVAVCVKNGNSTYQLGGLKTVSEILEQPCNTVLDGSLVQTWNQTIWPHKVEGLAYADYMSKDAYSALVSTNPSVTPYMSLVCGTTDEPASSVNGVYVTVSLQFHTKFYEQNPLAQS